ncbi:Pycsar system effector family protein [Goodfellowiella coeruleoviolacea]|uniref:Pycsar effector protein domain-containing protein n=1 Tax=Goodfellowiella coeruleoviolacea TaxID=334858 RepID=A0AAE3GAQ4_9PSEU|nr:Pycsar system effector family protein [Goodfellowiella coeruleoviolacea]MCP2163980.1 hypothetical protein [Goodfellowiella coeruleoviolacea]
MRINLIGSTRRSRDNTSDDNNTEDRSAAEGTALVERMLADNQAEIGRADQKAFTTLGVLGAATSVALGGALTEQGMGLHLAGPAQLARWAGMSMAALAVLLLLFAVYPRFRDRGDHRRVNYFGHTLDLADEAALSQGLRNTADDPTAAAVRQFRATSQIVIAKYRLVRWGICCCGAGMVLMLASFF